MPYLPSRRRLCDGYHALYCICVWHKLWIESWDSVV